MLATQVLLLKDRIEGLGGLHALMAHQVGQGSQVLTVHEIILGKPMTKRVRIGPTGHPGPLLQTLQHLIDPADRQLLTGFVRRENPVPGPLPGLPDRPPYQESIPRLS